MIEHVKIFLSYLSGLTECRTMVNHYVCTSYNKNMLSVCRVRIWDCTQQPQTYHQTTHRAIIIPTTCKAEVDTGHTWPTYPLSALHQGAPPLWYLLLKILVNPFSGRTMYDTLMYWYTTRRMINKGAHTIINIYSLALSLCNWYNLRSQQHIWYVTLSTGIPQIHPALPDISAFLK